MPNITEDMFRQGAMTADYDTVMELTNRVTEMLTQASTARIEKDGHVLTLDLAGRPASPAPACTGKRARPETSPPVRPTSPRWKAAPTVL